jgi:nitric oxide reductase activation protein
MSTKPARRVFSRGRILAAFLAAGAVLLAAAQTQQNGGASSTTTAQAGSSNPQAEKPSADTANSDRKKQLSEDSEKLLKLATDLKAEVDKTTKDTLSINVIRKADEIEKLAHSVKEKMRVSPAGN